MKTVLLLCLVAMLSACGQAPSLPNNEPTNTLVAPAPGSLEPIPVIEPTPVPSASPTVTPVTVVTYAFDNVYDICRDVRAWNPAATTLVIQVGPASLQYYTFAASGVTLGAQDGSDGVPLTRTINYGNPGNCSIYVNNGQLVSVQ